MLKIKLVILELYKQVTQYLFELEADERRHTGVIRSHPKLRQAVNKTWGAVWDSFETLSPPGRKLKRKEKVDNNNLNLFNKKLLFKNDDVPCRCDW